MAEVSLDAPVTDAPQVSLDAAPPTPAPEPVEIAMVSEEERTNVLQASQVDNASWDAEEPELTHEERAKIALAALPNPFMSLGVA